VSEGELEGKTMKRVLVTGATGTIGRATVQALLQRGFEVVAVVRSGSAAKAALPAAATVREAEVLDAAALARDGLADERFDIWVSCLASRTGEPADAWRVDHRAHSQALALLRAHGVQQVVLLSALCVQKPRLAFQQAKLAFEAELRASGLRWSIVRPTAFFKSLSGQLARVRAGKPFLVFGDGRLTACKPISDRDLADYIAGCIDDPTRHDRVLPIGGPGPALTPLDQVALLSQLLGRELRVKRVPVKLLDGIAATLALLGRVLPPLRAKAELARIGRYYATESMLVWDAEAGRYDADATPESGTDTLHAHYAALLRGEVADQRREHAVF
jgi:divinyl chlorophyllide a 8-vinyl-reductase